MIKALRGAVSVCLLVAALPSGAGAQSLVIRGGTLIDGTGRPPRENAQIVIRDGTIAEIATSVRDVPEKVEAVDARGKFILPGLIDSHVHYRGWSGELFLTHGVTTVYDLGDPYHWQASLQKGFNSGRLRGPRFFFCGEIALPSTETQNEGPAINVRSFDVIHKAEDASAIVSRIKDAGINCIKLNENFGGDLFTVIAKAAQNAGLRIISHSWNATESARWGIGGIEHMEGIAIATATSPSAKEAIGRMRLEAGHKNSALYRWMEAAEFDRVVQELVRRQVFVNPTLAFEWKALTEHAREHEQEDMQLLGIPALSYFSVDDRLMILGQYHWADGRQAEEIRQFKSGYKKVQQFLARFAQAGGKIYAGTDSSAATTPGLSLHHEMQLLVDAGLTPMQAIIAATSSGAELLGLQRKLGTVEPGKIADLVLVDANPLQDITNTKRIFKVIKDGRLVDTSYHADYENPLRRPGPESKHLYNPVPVLRDVTPPVAVENESATLRIVGRGFTPSSVVKFGETAVATRWISSTELAATLSPRHTARVGTFRMTVETPKPGGGSSEPVDFMITFK